MGFLSPGVYLKICPQPLLSVVFLILPILDILPFERLTNPNSLSGRTLLIVLAAFLALSGQELHQLFQDYVLIPSCCPLPSQHALEGRKGRLDFQPATSDHFMEKWNPDRCTVCNAGPSIHVLIILLSYMVLVCFYYQ